MMRQGFRLLAELHKFLLKAYMTDPVWDIVSVSLRSYISFYDIEPNVKDLCVEFPSPCGVI